MNKKIAFGVLAACASIAIGESKLVNADQDSTRYPGYPTQGRVWIQNRGQDEAVPVIIQGAVQGPPMRVLISGVPAVTLGSGSALDARAARQSWEYREITISPTQSPVSALNAAGSEGWETTGLSIPSSNGGTIMVLKRPK